MLSIRVGDDVYGLDDAGSADLVRRLELASPGLPGGEPEPGTTLDKLRDAVHSQEPADLDDTDLALVGVVLEAWAVEVDGDLPSDVLELRYAISARLS
jgi:hypothetical protein